MYYVLFKKISAGVCQTWYQDVHFTVPSNFFSDITVRKNSDRYFIYIFFTFLSFLDFVCFLMFACLFLSHLSKHIWFIDHNVWIFTLDYVSALGIRGLRNMCWRRNVYCWWPGHFIIQRSSKHSQS